MARPLLFVLGDSISIQYGPHLERFVRTAGWHYQRKGGVQDIEAEAGDPVFGANGGDSRRVRAFLGQRRARGGFEPDLLLLNCGLHDLKLPHDSEERQVPLDAYRANLEAILDIVPAATRPVWVRTTPVDEAVHAAVKDFRRLEADVDAYNLAADAVMASAGVASIDLFTFSRSFGPDVLSEDGVHFAHAVRPLQAAYIAGALARLWADGR